MEKEYHRLTIRPISNDVNVHEDPADDYNVLTTKTNTLNVTHRSQPSESTINFILGNYKKGDDGNTPYIGENDNWWIDGVDTGKPSRGEKGDTPLITVGLNGN
jgi:hypothetical protein